MLFAIGRIGGIMRSRSNYALVIIAALLLALLAGCAGSRDAEETDEDFFLPVSPVRDTTVMKNLPGVNISEGMPQEIKSDGDFGDPLTAENVLVIENIPIEAMQDSLSILGDQVSYMQTILEASTIDPKMYYHSQVKAWRITNPVLRDSLFYTLIAIDSSIQSESGTDAEVLATERNDLIEVKFGNSVFKGITLREALEKSSDKFLYRKIIASGGFSKDIELRDTNFTIPTPLKPELLTLDQMNDKFIRQGNRPSTRLGMVDLSLYGLNFRLGPSWGTSIKMGNDELGLPFWSSGAAAIMATYKEFRVGFDIPFKGGRNGGDRFPLFTIRNRVLNGSRGLIGEFDIGNFGGKFSSTKLNNSDTGELTSFGPFYYVAQEMLGYYSFAFSLNKANYLRLKVGLSSYEVQQAHLTVPSLNGVIVEDETHTFTSPYVKAEYIHDLPNERYGGSLQYVDANVLATAWLDIVPHTLSIEMKYSRIIARPIRDWELPDFVMLSPRWFFEF